MNMNLTHLYKQCLLNHPYKTPISPDFLQTSKTAIASTTLVNLSSFESPWKPPKKLRNSQEAVSHQPVKIKTDGKFIDIHNIYIHVCLYIMILHWTFTYYLVHTQQNILCTGGKKSTNILILDLVSM